MAQSAVITAPIAYETAGLEAGLAAAVVAVLAEARARTHMTTSRMLGDTALAGLAAAVVLVAMSGRGPFEGPGPRHRTAAARGTVAR